MWRSINKGKNVWTINPSASTTDPYTSVMLSEIHVLLVDLDLESLYFTGRMLESCQYKVTYAENASAALSKLSAGGYITSFRFDVVMADIDSSPDLHGDQLMMQAVNLGIPTVLLSCDNNVFKTRKAIELGALFYVKKPVPLGLLQYLWQVVMREKMQKLAVGREKHIAASINNNNGLGIKPVSSKYVVNNRVEQSPNTIVVECNDNMNVVPVPKKVPKSRSTLQFKSGNNFKDRDAWKNQATVKKCSEAKRNTKIFYWTDEKHQKFVDAIEKLGEGRCFPKDILRLMNVPGLTRTQVASHLQQCRYRKNNSGTSDATGSARSRPPRMFGTKPMLSRPTRNQTLSSEPAHQLASRDRGGLENMGITGPLMDNVAQHYQPAVPVTQQPDDQAQHAHYSSSPAMMPLSDDFCFDAFIPDMINLIQRFDDYSAPPAQVSTSGFDDALNPNAGGNYQLHDPNYNIDHPQWSAGFSSFANDELSGPNAGSHGAN